LLFGEPNPGAVRRRTSEHDLGPAPSGLRWAPTSARMSDLDPQLYIASRL